MRIITVSIILFLLVPICWSVEDGKSEESLPTKNLCFNLIETRLDAVRPIACVFAGNNYLAKIITDNQQKDDLRINIMVLGHSIDYSSFTIQYELISTMRFFDASGKEEASSPTSNTCKGIVVLQSGKVQAVLTSKSLTYEIMMKLQEDMPVNNK